MSLFNVKVTINQLHASPLAVVSFFELVPRVVGVKYLDDTDEVRQNFSVLETIKASKVEVTAKQEEGERERERKREGGLTKSTETFNYQNKEITVGLPVNFQNKTSTCRYK